MASTTQIECKHCKQFFAAENRYLKRGHASFCSKQCVATAHSLLFRIETCCQECKVPISVRLSEKRIHNFCGRSCSAKYNNKNKTHGTRRSKLEIWIETRLSELYPALEMHFNRKDAINSELDIYIPCIKLAFELNGLFHYEPIFGSDKLSAIQNNDQRKFQACLERGIELCIIDSSQLKNFKEEKAKQYLDIIRNIVSRKLSQVV